MYVELLGLTLKAVVMRWKTMWLYICSLLYEQAESLAIVGAEFGGPCSEYIHDRFSSLLLRLILRSFKAVDECFFLKDKTSEFFSFIKN